MPVLARNRGKTIKDPRVFRFDATRFVGRVGQQAGVSSDSLLSLVCFEVQIRAAFEHAWSVTTHKLSYKGPGIDWRRERLTAVPSRVRYGSHTTGVRARKLDQVLRKHHEPHTSGSRATQEPT